MAKKRRNNTSKAESKEKQDVYVSDETVELESNDNVDISNNTETAGETNLSNNIIDEKENAVDAAVKEYNGEINQENTEEKRIKVRDKADVAKVHKVNKKAIAITCSVIFALIISLVALAVINKMNSNVYRNIYLDEKNISGMTTAELTDYLKTEQERLSKSTLKVLQGEEKILEIMPSDINFEIDVAAVEEQIFRLW